MVCYHLNPAKRSVSGIKFCSNENAEFLLPCGNCIGCRLLRAKHWAVRCANHLQSVDDGIFLTLTYDNDHLPKGGTLVKSHIQGFIKRLRERIGKPISYFYCGEYGSKFGRPHYHVLLFGFRPFDSVLYRTTKLGNKLFTSEFIENVWGQGFAPFGDLNFETAAYTCRYILKKVSGDLAKSFYLFIDSDGTVFNRLSEFSQPSLKHAIGKQYFFENYKDLFNNDFVTYKTKDGVRRSALPRYYNKLFEQFYPKLYCDLKARRQAFDRKLVSDERYVQMERCELLNLKKFERSLDVLTLDLNPHFEDPFLLFTPT